MLLKLSYMILTILNYSLLPSASLQPFHARSSTPCTAAALMSAALRLLTPLQALRPVPTAWGGEGGQWRALEALVAHLMTLQKPPRAGMLRMQLPTGTQRY